MLKIVLVLTSIILASSNVRGQRHFRLKAVADVDFLLPPKTKLGQEGLFGNKQSLQYSSRLRYHRILISGLKGNSYNSFLNTISRAKYVHDDKPITSTWLRENWNATGAATVVNASAKIYFSDDNTGLVLEMDYSSIMNHPEAYFNQLAIELLTAFRIKETSSPNWPSSVCQEMIWKIFSLLPVPAASALSALGFIQAAAGYSLLLLHPRTSLRIDHEIFDDKTSRGDVEAMDQFMQGLLQKSRESNSDVIQLDTSQLKQIHETVDWKYVMTGQTIMNLFKVQNSNNDVLFKQIPFLSSNMNRTLFPDNQFKSNVHLSSSGDIELSARIGTAPFLFLYMKYFMGNNSNATINSSTIRNCCRDANGLPCNSLILFRQDLNELSSPTDYCNTKLTDYGSFGERALTVPVIPVFVNGSLTYQPLGLKLEDLVQSSLVNKENNLEREARDGYRTIKKRHNIIYLLPGDRITNL